MYKTGCKGRNPLNFWGLEITVPPTAVGYRDVPAFSEFTFRAIVQYCTI